MGATNRAWIMSKQTTIASWRTIEEGLSSENSMMPLVIKGPAADVTSAPKNGMGRKMSGVETARIQLRFAK